MADDEAPVRRQGSKRPRPLRAEPLIEDELRASHPPLPPPPPLVAPEPQRDRLPSDVIVELDGPEPQRRATVAFRIILAIPHFVYLLVLNLVTAIAVVAAWFVALVIGRLPDGLATFIGRVIQYNARVYAYAGLLLTDRYPSFGLDEPDASVNVRFSPDRLNRAAVLFRLVLLIPAAIVSQLLASGYVVASVVVWLIVLIKGRLPTALFEAEAATLRYQTRYWSYVTMLTSEYPRELFGDKKSVTADDEFAPLPARPKITTLVLSTAGKRLVVLFIVLGVVFQIGSNAFLDNPDAATHDAITRAHADLDNARTEFTISAQSCAVSGGLDCLHAADNLLADAFEEFRVELHSHKYDDAALTIAEELDADTAEVIAMLRRMATMTDRAQYQAAAGELQRLFAGFDEDYDDLEALLRF